jgi:hypothetical protein
VNAQRRHLRGLFETTAYPGLLSRLGTTPDADTSLVSDLVWDVLEPDTSDEATIEGRFQRALEEGEIAAAQVLLEWKGLAGEARIQIQRTRALREQELADSLRYVMGLLLLLKDVPGSRTNELSRRVDQLCDDAYLRKNRPGRMLQSLGRLTEDLERHAKDAFDAVRAELGELRTAVRPVNERDLKPTLDRLEALLAGDDAEALPAAQQLAALARRARNEQLNPDDLRLMHQQTVAPGRLLRPRDLLPIAASAAEFLEKLQKNDLGLYLSDETARTAATEMFGALIGERGTLKPSQVARAVLTFIGVNVQTYHPAHEGRPGCTYRFAFHNPRIPALASPSHHFQDGVQFAVPARVDSTTLQQLIQASPARALRVVYVASLADHPPRVTPGDSDLAFIDNLDLLRLAECPTAQREHAFQQTVLARLKVSRIKPYQTGGPVPAEMFRGRREVMQKLVQPRGGTVLFSGRMMGKSSILTMIDRSIRALHKPGDPPRSLSVFVSSAGEDLLRPLFTKLCELPLDDRNRRKFLELERETRESSTLRPKQRRERAQKRLQGLRTLITELLTPGRRLTILIDEADKFAAADAELPREESLAWCLRDLEYEKPERLRVVFAGFQAIHRQVLFRNGAFANWFGLVQLGPLAPDDARQLVTEPFADLGFVFQSQAGVDRILEFTARHPLLLQETCGRLLDRVAARRRNPLDEAVRVSAGDVESVCRDDHLRERVRQVLSLNLEPDPRLKLLVYLILFASTARVGSRSLSLDGFRLDDLKDILIDFYGNRFSHHFDESKIGALMQELRALGLIIPRGDTYEFANRTFATMLREEMRFDEELQRLLEAATSPETSESRVYPTLSTDGLERLLTERAHPLLVVGLPGTLRSSIAKGMRPEGGQEAKSILVEAGPCSSLDDLQEVLRKQLKEARKLTVGEMLVKAGVQLLVLDNADAFAGAGALGPLSAQLAGRALGLVAFGGAGLARTYVSTLAADTLEVVRLERLGPANVKAWGERDLPPDEGPLLTFDEATSRKLVAVTGGHLALVEPLRGFVRARSGGRESIPDSELIDSFARESLTPSTVRTKILSGLEEGELGLLRSLIETARENGWAPLDWESVDDMVLQPLAASSGQPKSMWLDRLEVLSLLDLVEDRPNQGRRQVSVPGGQLLLAALS